MERFGFQIAYNTENLANNFAPMYYDYCFLLNFSVIN